MSFRNPLTLATVVEANEFQLISPTTGAVVAELSEPVPQVASLELGTPGGAAGSMQWDEQNPATVPLVIYGPVGPANPANVALDRQPYLSAYSGGGLGVPGANLLLDGVLPEARLWLDDGYGLPTDGVSVTAAGIDLTTSAGAKLNGRPVRLCVADGEVTCTAGIVGVPTVATDIPGCAWSVDLVTGDTVRIWPIIDYIRTAAGGLLVCEVWVDDGGGYVALPKQVVGGNTAARADGAQAMSYTAATTGSHSFKLTGHRTGAGSYNINIQHTGALFDVLASI